MQGQGTTTMDAENVVPLTVNRRSEAALESIARKPELQVAAPVANAKREETSPDESVSGDNDFRLTIITEATRPATAKPEQPSVLITARTTEEEAANVVGEEEAANEGENDSEYTSSVDKVPTEILTEDSSEEILFTEGTSMVETVSELLQKDNMVQTLHGESTAESAMDLSLNYNVHDDESEQDIEIERNPTEDCQRGDDVMKDVEAATDPVDNFQSSQNTDPFEVREGRTLIWKNVNMTLVRKLERNSTIGSPSFSNALFLSCSLLAEDDQSESWYEMSGEKSPRGKQPPLWEPLVQVCG
jgi:hypothetical protein